jgi:hypothetical protein
MEMRREFPAQPPEIVQRLEKRQRKTEVAHIAKIICTELKFFARTKHMNAEICKRKFQFAQ